MGKFKKEDEFIREAVKGSDKPWEEPFVKANAHIKQTTSISMPLELSMKLEYILDKTDDNSRNALIIRFLEEKVETELRKLPST